LAAKEQGLLKLEQALMEKEKRLANMRKRIQNISEVVTQRGETVIAAIEQYNSQLSSLAAYESIDEIVKTIQQQASRVSSIWEDMAAHLERV
jgi:succinylarginine dihydrolase